MPVVGLNVDDGGLTSLEGGWHHLNIDDSRGLIAHIEPPVVELVAPKLSVADTPTE